MQYGPFMIKPLVSIIIPTYNRALYLEEALNSIFIQDYDNYEVIVVDDGSTDDTMSVIDRYASDSRLQYEYQQNSGKPSIARNKGLQIARGDYVAFLDSDDLLSANSILLRLEILEKYADVGLVTGSWADYDFANSHKNLNTILKRHKNWFSELPDLCVSYTSNHICICNENIAFELFNSDIIFTSSVMLRSSILRDIGFFSEDIKLGEDYDLWLRIAIKYKIGFIFEAVSIRRTHEENISKCRDENYDWDLVVLNNFHKRSGTVPKLIKKRYCNRICSYLYNTGTYFLDKNMFDKARRRFISAIILKPWSTKAFIYYIFSLLPMTFIKNIRRLRNG